MSTVASGPVTGLGVAAIGIATVAAAVPLAAILLGRATVLVAKGIASATVYVGKQVREAYLEHERHKEEQLRQDAEVKERIAELRRTLSQEIEAPRTPVQVKRVKARVLNRVAADHALAEQLLREVEATVAPSQAEERMVPGSKAPQPSQPLASPASAVTSLAGLDTADRRGTAPWSVG